MEIMDDVLDLKDSIEDALEREKRKAQQVLRGESGFSTLVMVLVIMAVGAIIITPILAFVVVGTKAGETHDRNTDRFYAADAGIQDGIWCVSSGDYADERSEWKGTWDESVYSSDPLTYDVADLNGCDVTVTIRPIWLLSGVEDPSATQGRTPESGLSTVMNALGGGKMQVVIIMDTALQSTTKIKRIGFWLPEGCQYTMGSSDLEKLAGTNPAHCHPTADSPKEWKNGHTIVFEYSTPVSFTSLPNVTGKRMVLSFDYTGSGAPTGVWSWCRADINGSSDYYLGWSSDIKIFQVESTATDPDTGVTTTVVAGQMTNESVGTYLAYYGDYAVTGNALLRDKSSPADDFRETAYLSSPGDISDIPDSATPRKVLLYWSGFKYYPQNVSSYSDDQLLQLAYDYGVTEVSLKVTVDGDTWTAPDPVEAEKVQVLKGTLMGSPDGWVYSCEADITDMVKEEFGDDYVGNATYTIGHANLTASPPTLRGVWGSGASNIFAVGNNGYILHYDGTSWSPMSSGTNNTLYGVWGSGTSNVFAVGAGGTILRYNGTSWSSMNSGTTSDLRGVWGTASNSIYAVGAGGTILYYNGTSWASRSSGTTSNLYGIWGTASNNIYAVGAGGTIRKYTTSWAASTSGITSDLYGIWGTASNNIYAVGAGGTVRRYTTSWGSGGTSGTTNTLYGIWGTASNNIYAVGASGTIRRYTSSWGNSSSGTTSTLYGVWGTASNNIYAVGDSGTMRKYVSSWSAVSLGTSLYGWLNAHGSGETVSATTNQPLGDPATDTSMNWHIASCAWSVLVLYTSPVTLAHQMYLYDTLRYNDSSDYMKFDLDGFLAPASVATEDDAVRLTCFVSEGDDTYNPESIWMKAGTKSWTCLSDDSSGALDWDNVWNKASGSGGATGFAPDCLDLDTFTVPKGYMSPTDSSASIWIGDDDAVFTTQGSGSGQDAWNLVYMILSFRSDNVGSGVLTYVVI